MTLKEYFALTGIKKSFFAEKIGATPQQMSHWENGNYRPSLEYVYAIEIETQGLVMLSDWVKKSDPKLK